MNYEWKIQSPPEEMIREYMQELGVSHILAAALINNHLSVDTANTVFRAPDYDKIYQPQKIENIHEAAVLLKQYLDDPNSMIQIFADYDTDGITSAAIACKGLRRIFQLIYPERNSKIAYYIPERKDGYGLSVSFAEQFITLADTNPDMNILVLTVDNGITAKPAIDILQRKKNIKVLVTDHHEPDYENNLTPTHDCICVDPAIKADSEGKLLAGCGIIFNVLQELESLYGLDHDVTVCLYYLLAIGTIGDMMEMDLYNLCVVQVGLSQLNAEQSLPWIEYLREKAGINRFTAKDIAFTVSPMINSCGQMGQASLPFMMLVADKEEEMLQFAEQIYKIYLDNKNETKDTRDMAELDIMTNYVKEHPFVLYPMKTNRPGLVSKVATHLAKQIAAPIILWAETDENANEEVIAGSARNDTALPALPVLREAARVGLIESAEGHMYAFGVKLYRSKLPDLQKFLDDKIKSYGTDARNKTRYLTIDSVISTNDINVENMRDIEQFPFSKNLAAPVVMIQGARIVRAKASKNNARNICYTIQSPGATYPIDVWAWNIKPTAYDPDQHTKIDMVGTIERNFMKPAYATLSVIDLRFY